MLVNLSEKTVAFLREASQMWAEVKAVLRLVRSIRGSGAARVTTTPTGIVIHVDPVTTPPPEAGGYRYAPYLIVSSEEIASNQWEYTVAPTQGGGTNYTGRSAIPGITYKMRNAWEESPAGKALYQGDDITGIYPLPDNGAVSAYWSTRNGNEPVLICHERNQARCD